LTLFKKKKESNNESKVTKKNGWIVRLNNEPDEYKQNACIAVSSRAVLSLDDLRSTTQQFSRLRH